LLPRGRRVGDEGVSLFCNRFPRFSPTAFLDTRSEVQRRAEKQRPPARWSVRARSEGVAAEPEAGPQGTIQRELEDLDHFVRDADADRRLEEMTADRRPPNWRSSVRNVHPCVANTSERVRLVASGDGQDEARAKA